MRSRPRRRIRTRGPARQDHLRRCAHRDHQDLRRAHAGAAPCRPGFGRLRLRGGATAARFNALMSGASSMISAVAIQLQRRRERLQQSRPGRRIRQGPAVHRRGREHQFGQRKIQIVLRRFLDAHNKSVQWFLDNPKNRQELIHIMVEASKSARNHRQDLRFSR